MAIFLSIPVKSALRTCPERLTYLRVSAMTWSTFPNPYSNARPREIFCRRILAGCFWLSYATLVKLIFYIVGQKCTHSSHYVCSLITCYSRSQMHGRRAMGARITITRPFVCSSTDTLCPKQRPNLKRCPPAPFAPPSRPPPLPISQWDRLMRQKGRRGRGK